MEGWSEIRAGAYLSSPQEQKNIFCHKLTLFLVYCFSDVSQKGREAVLCKAFN